MLALVEVSHLNDQVVLGEAQRELDDKMIGMGFTKLVWHDAPSLRSVYYDVRDLQVGVRPAYLVEEISRINTNPDRYRFEVKLIAETNMPRITPSR